MTLNKDCEKFAGYSTFQMKCAIFFISPNDEKILHAKIK